MLEHSVPKLTHEQVVAGDRDPVHGKESQFALANNGFNRVWNDAIGALRHGGISSAVIR